MKDNMVSIDDYYITFLKYAREQMRVRKGGLDYAGIFEHVCNIHGEVDELAFKRTYLQAAVPVGSLGRATQLDDIGNVDMVLSLEAYFHLLEHEELLDARKASQAASKSIRSNLKN